MTDSFKKLTESVEQMLCNLHYSENTISKYRRHCNRISEFMLRNEIENFSKSVGENYFFTTYGYKLEKIPSERTRDMSQCRRTIEVLLEYQHSETMYRRRSSKNHIFQECFQPAADNFMSIIRQNYARTSCRQFQSRLENFLDYLYDHNCRTFSSITKDNILGYWKTREIRSKTTQEYDCYFLRKFLDYLYENSYTQIDNSVFVPYIKGNRKGRLPSYYTTEEITTLLSSVERSNPVGKRDYALLLIAIRYGMRIGDIRNLKLSDINWHESKFTFCQSKSEKVITFPLLEDVATALIDYFQNGRPETSCRNIFVRHNAPFDEFGKDDNLHYIINKYMRISGITGFHHRKHGFHIFRHSIAGNMLNMGIPLPVVSEVLSHSKTDTTMIYTKIGIDQLKTCALEVK